jgi:hypothetical protein
MPDETTQTPAPVAAPATDTAAPSTVAEPAPAAPAAPVLPPPLAVGDAIPDSPDSDPAIDVTDTAADDATAVNGDSGGTWAPAVVLDGTEPTVVATPAIAAPTMGLTATAAAAYVRCAKCSYKPCSVECYVKAGYDAAGFDACVAACEETHAAALADVAAPPPETHHVIEIAHGSVRIQNAQYLSGPKQTGNAWLPGAVLRVDVATAEGLYKTSVAKRVTPKSE